MPTIIIYLCCPFTINSHCCDWKARAVSAQSFTLWQQATIEITWHDQSVIACSRHIYMGVVLHTYPIMVNHTFNAMPTQRLQKHHLHFTMNRTDHTSHVGHSTILLRSENLSGKCAKLHIVAAGNDRDHTP